MIAVIFGIQGVGKSSVVNGVLNNFSEEDGFKLLQWGERTYNIAIEKKIIRIGDYRSQGEFEVISEDAERGVTIVMSNQRENIIFAKDEGCLKNAKDEIRHLNLKTQEALQEDVAGSFSQEIQANRNANYLIETHAALKTSQGYLPGMTDAFMKEVKPDIYIIIEANADEIFVRRLTDKKRKREHDKTTKDVQINIDTTRYFASDFAVFTHCPLVIVENKNKLVGDAIQEITEILRNF